MSKKQKAIDLIEQHGALLVFPIDNRPEPKSLWICLHPRTKMKWEWDSGGDDRVANLWALREELSRSDEVVYTKWYRGRATFFSKQCFTDFLTVVREASSNEPLTPAAQELLDALQENSPLSTKALKLATDLRGRDNEPTYVRALKELWERLLIVGYGEFDDGAFPSLGMGAANSLFEELVSKAESQTSAAAKKRIESVSSKDSLFLKFLGQLIQKWNPTRRN